MPKMDPKGADAMRKAMTGEGEPGILEKIRKALGLDTPEEPAQEDVSSPEAKKEKTRNLLSKLRDRGSNIQPSSESDEEQEIKRRLEEELASPARPSSSGRGLI